MKTISKTIAVGLIALVSFGSCKKETTNTGSNYSSVQSFFSQSKMQTQTFTVNASLGGTITGAKGTVVTFPSNAFVKGNGATVTGSVTIELKEVFSKKDMIYEGVYPVAYGQYLLNSGGEYFLSATQNGVQVNVKKGRFFEVALPAQQVDPNMQFFIMGPDSGMDGANWVLPDTAVVQVDSQWVVSPVNGFNFTTVPDSAYVINIDSLTWGNADVFMSPTYVTCSFKVEGVTGVSETNTKAYCIFDGFNTVWPCGVNGWGSITNNIVTDNHVATIPSHILIISVIDGQLHAGSAAVTPAAGITYNVTVAPITKEALDALILSFN